MSNEIYGFIVSMIALERRNALFAAFEKRFAIGIREVGEDELIGFSDDMLEEGNKVPFLISDRPGGRNATYLADFVDYAGDAQIGLPVSGRQRVGMLVSLLTSLYAESEASRMCVAITDSSQIESVKYIRIGDLLSVLLNDLDEMAPSCTLYVVGERYPEPSLFQR